MDKRFTTVPGFSDRRRIPLGGKIRLGIKTISKKSGKEYPKEVEHFVVPEEVQKVYGEKPTKLDVMLPSSDRSMVMPCSLRRYGSTAGLKCIGNMSVAYDVIEKKDTECPCQYYEKGECNKVGFLFVILYKVNLGVVYQIRTQSQNSVTDILSGMDYVEGLLRRPCSMIPLILRRDPIETHHEGKKQTHYTMKLYFEGNIDQANLLIQDTKRIYTNDFLLPAPKDENPAFDKVDVIEENNIVDEEKEDEKPPQENDELEGIHLQELAKRIKAMLKEKGVFTKEREMKLIHSVNLNANKYGELSREDMVMLYYKIKHDEFE